MEELSEHFLEKDFANAVAYLNRSSHLKLNDNQKLRFYGLYKQVTVGNCNISKPYFWEFTLRDMMGAAKWEAWNSLKDTSKEAAMTNCIYNIKHCYSIQDIAELEKLDSDWRSKDQKSSSSVTTKSSSSSGGPVFSRMVADDEEIQESQKDFCYYATTAPLSKVAELLQTNKDLVHFVNSEGLTALHYACDRGNLELAEFLLQNGADVNARDGEGQTSLHYAAVTGNKEAVVLLLRWKADTSLADNDGATPLDVVELEEIKALLH